ncbi:FAD-dependent oxidoreductase [Flavobacterium sp. ASW18X]|uniref:flavin monoamine oxidase family protein n=1 Tax=Flavobacterium sp. ASW18X TaxID=2572595 RepID=UPI0010AECFB6|nr:FAD-dependent oxidoreductase [Flavobacterium sp. ASW18X]TKD67019.1 amine oxidase [Flavobacterium sp. ASW18X]
MAEHKPILIIGGGLSGLYLAYRLHKANIPFKLLEASPRLGGRIYTLQGLLGTPLELGATWFADIHTDFNTLLEELRLNKFPQFDTGLSLFQTKSFEPPQKFYVPENETPSYRIEGGTASLINALTKAIPKDAICLNTAVTKIQRNKNDVTATTLNGDIYRGTKLCLAIPPALVETLDFNPPLPENLMSILPKVQTWMLGSIKFVIEYRKPFWREQGYSGMLFSHSGIITEMYDHTDFTAQKFGFTGFLNAGASEFTKEVRKDYALKQLVELLGKEALDYIHYQDKVWNHQWISNGAQNILRPHQNNGHTLLQKAYLNDCVYFVNTEAATAFSGYMEGAIRAVYTYLRKTEILP